MRCSLEPTAMSENLQETNTDDLLFNDISFYSIGLSPETLNVLQQHGAIKESYLHDMINVCIVALDLEDSKQSSDLISETRYNYDKVQIVTDDWVTLSLVAQKILPYKVFAIDYKVIFKNYLFCLSQLSVTDKRTLWFILTHHGAKCTLRLSKACTHLVIGRAVGAKYEKAQNTNIKIITPDWILDAISLKNSQHDCTAYHPSLLLDDSSYGSVIDCVLEKAATSPPLSQNNGIAPIIIPSADSLHREGNEANMQYFVNKASHLALQKDKASSVKRSRATKNMMRKKLNVNPLPHKGFISPNSISPTINPAGVHSSIYFGHDPDQRVPPECCLLACRFYLDSYTDIIPEQELKTWKKVIEAHGGAVCPNFNVKVTHLVCPTHSSKHFEKCLIEGRRIVTASWLNDVLTDKVLRPPSEALHFPRAPCQPLLNYVISVTGFIDVEREKVKMMIQDLGGSFSPNLTRECSYLICKSLTGAKYSKACEWNTPTINVQWLNDLWLIGKAERLASPKYQNFENPEALKLDINHYSPVISRFMTCWSRPLRVSAVEIRKRSPYWEYSLLKRKQEASSDFRLVKKTKTNADGTTKDLEIFAPSRIQDNMPRVVFTGFTEEEIIVLRTKIFSLGGTLATSMYTATHLIAPRILRTVKFLIGVSLIPNIVTSAWINESFEKRWLLDEYDFFISDTETEELLGFRLKAAVKRSSESKLFSGINIYLTPGVEPRRDDMQQIVEAAGGRLLDLEPDSSDANGKNERSIIVSCDQDISMCSKYTAKNLQVFSSELIITGVLTQRLDFDVFQLEIPKA